jgi:hypothetical protein
MSLNPQTALELNICPEVWKELPEEIRLEILHSSEVKPRISAGSNTSDDNKLSNSNAKTLKQISVIKSFSNVPKRIECNSLAQPREETSSQLTSPSELYNDQSFTSSLQSITGLYSDPVDSISSSSATCTCGLNVSVKVVNKAGPNQGRSFACCSHKTCNYFKWINRCSESPYVASLIAKYGSIEWRRFR